MADDPFDTSDRGDRTVFRPNPGGRRPAAPAAPPPGAAPAAPQAPTPRDDWGLVQRQTPEGPAVVTRPMMLKRDQMIVPHQNPIMRAAGPMLVLLGRLRIALMRASFAELMEHVAESLKAFELDVRAAGIDDAQTNAAKYVLCATADDIVQNIPSEDRHVWAQYSMLSRFFGERIGGVRFFQEVDKSIADPLHNVELLELEHACLALGFQGKYRTMENGAAQLHDIQKRVYEVLKSVRRAPPEDLSPRWRGLALRSQAGRLRVPVWVVAAVLLAGLSALYITYLTLLGGGAEVAAAEVVGLHPPTQMALLRKAPVPPPPPPPPPPPEPVVTTGPLTQMQRIRSTLAAEIASGDISADAVGTHVIIRVGSNFLFESGKADVKPVLRPLAKRMAEMLEKEAGPILVIGHTDNVAVNPGGRFKSNFELSLERAKQVSLLLGANLSTPARLKPEGRGEQEPVAPNDTADNKARNRRVEIWIDRAD
ncbi:type VI secretion system protein TssL [Siculibacillus lacustris]|uniref:Type VI secretion system protein TssL n=1 Tax=Siculibacillus lacustris TaxID=1549641 RepID=A0A4V2KTB7_9HYPH|nr:type IVB secretion system protein IcmH/DotU [Siculibacillus lacustris]TBW36594.1 type VI secretion system protein TssL [Siculibacillus lacustris]